MEHTVSNNLLQYEDPFELDPKETKGRKHSVAAPTLKLKSVADAAISMKTGVEPTREEIDELLNLIFPPEEFDDYDGNSYKQKVSSKPPTLEDVKALEVELDNRLRARHARNEGLCNIRRELFTQAMDELIRQETIECPERGLLLKRMRDEIRMTFAVYKSLFDSSVAYESRKSVMNEAVQVDLLRTSEENEPALIELRKRFQTMQDKVEQAEIRVVEQAEADHKRRVDEVEFYKSIGTQLRLQLDKILAPKKNL